MSTIICRNLTFAYPGAEQVLFERLDLTLDTNWRTALTGRNGRGKTTLLRLLHGDLQPELGAVERSRPSAYFPHRVDDPRQPVRQVVKDAIGPFRQWEAEMEALLNAGDEVSLGRYGDIQDRYQEAGGYAIDAGLETELTALGIEQRHWRRPFEGLSSGEQTRCLLASLFTSAQHFPLIDEPTNHLDRDGRRMLADYLCTKPGFLLISHDRAFLDACCDHVVALNADTVEVQRTSFSAWRRAYHQRLGRQRAKNAELKRDIVGFTQTAGDRRAGALKREAEKGAHVDKGFIGHRAKKQMKKAIIAEKRALDAAAERRETLIDIEKERRLRVHFGHDAPAFLAVANDLALWRGETCLFAHLSFSIPRGERVALTGPNGAGKTSLLDQIERAPYRHAGTLSRPGHVSIAHALQQPAWTTGRLRPRLQDVGLDESRFRQVLDALGVRGSVLDGALEDLSPGQQKKIELARAFLADADLLLLDEPLNFLDIDAREQIEDALLADQPTVVFVEHDAAFVERVATQVIDLSAAAASTD